MSDLQKIIDYDNIEQYINSDELRNQILLALELDKKDVNKRLVGKKRR